MYKFGNFGELIDVIVSCCLYKLTRIRFVSTVPLAMVLSRDRHML